MNTTARETCLRS